MSAAAFESHKRELREELGKLAASEAKIDDALNQYFGLGSDASSSGSFESRDLSKALAKIESAAPSFEAMLQDAKKLASQVDDGGSLSDRLSSIVRRLDSIQIRSQQALACTEDIMNMKDYKTKICLAIEQDDIVKAVTQVRQVMEIDAKAAVASDDFHVIMEKKNDLRVIVRNRFNAAIQAADIKTVMSLCPLLHTLELENEARDTFLNFVEQSLFIAITSDATSVESAAVDESTGYSQALLGIFNAAYLIIQQYLPMIIQGMENSQGDVHFIRRLHAKCEEQAGVVLKRYMKFRRVREMVSFLKGASAANDKHAWTAAEVHSIMDELALHIQYCNRYLKFIRHICKGAEGKKRKSGEPFDKVFAGPTDFDRMKDELVNKYYLEGEYWLMREGVSNALPRSIEEGIDSRLDESFFILQKCSLRAIATNDIHAACSIIHKVSELISSHVLTQATMLLFDSASRVGSVIQEHMNYFKRVVSSDKSLPDPLKSRDTLSSGFKNALSLVGSSSAAVNKEEAKDVIQYHENGGFWIAAPSVDPHNPWGVEAYLESFNLMELCARYTERLGIEIWRSNQSVFAAEEGEMEAKPTGKAGGGFNRLAAPVESLKNCKEDFDALKVSFSHALRQGAEKLVAIAYPMQKDILLTMLGRSANQSNALRFDVDDSVFDSQPGLSRLPKALTLPLETIVNVCTFNLGDKNKDLIVGLIVEACCQQLEELIAQTLFRYNGALKMEEISRTLSTMFSRFSTVPVRGKFSRLREVMLVLTSESRSGLITDHFTLLTTKEIESFLSLRVDLKL